MNAIGFYLRIIQALEEIRAPYMIVGAFAGLAFGVTRATFDVDILVNLRDDDFDALAERFPSPRYYADPEMMRNSTRMGIMFNIIDGEEGVKADLVPITREPGYRLAFDRRVRQVFQDEEGDSFEAWCAQPTDIIIGKLKAWAEGRSSKHPADIAAMLAFAFSGLSPETIDVQVIEIEAARLGIDVVTLWHDVLSDAQKATRRYKESHDGD